MTGQLVQCAAQSHSYFGKMFFSHFLTQNIKEVCARVRIEQNEQFYYFSEDILMQWWLFEKLPMNGNEDTDS